MSDVLQKSINTCVDLNSIKEDTNISYIFIWFLRFFTWPLCHKRDVIREFGADTCHDQSVVMILMEISTKSLDLSTVFFSHSFKDSFQSSFNRSFVILKFLGEIIKSSSDGGLEIFKTPEVRICLNRGFIKNLLKSFFKILCGYW